MKKMLLSALILSLGLSSCSYMAGAQTSLAVHQDAKLGPILTDDKGMTLYLYTKDTPNVTNCYDQCAVAWPPLTATKLPKLPKGTPGTLTLVPRKDGSQQVAYNGWPLYYWVKDTKPGETTGQNVGKVWYVLNPGPVLQTAKAGDLGTILTGANGMTLYMFTKDTPGVSNCYDQCAVNWPPLLVGFTPTAVDGVKGKLGTTTRKDGSMQVTYNDMPLYYWIKDAKVGDTTGQNVGGVWFVVNP